ncbi:MAG: hypothetical protein HY648_07400 [Acidobacteria bacterium]|nr:hypothetical protein [Acidobacteriota bacterium]
MLDRDATVRAEAVMGGKKPVRLKSASDAKVKIEVRSKRAKLIIELPERTRRRLLLQLRRLEPKG